MDPRDDAEYLTPRELARERRRDRDMDAERRALMGSGPAKVIKQIGDSWLRQAQTGKPKRKGAKGKQGKRS